MGLDSGLELQRADSLAYEQSLSLGSGKQVSAFLHQPAPYSLLSADWSLEFHRDGRASEIKNRHKRWRPYTLLLARGSFHAGSSISLDQLSLRKITDDS